VAERELAQAIERGDLAAKDRLVNSNLRLVVSLAKRYQNQGLSLLDVGEEGESTLGELLPGEAPEPPEEVEVSLRDDVVRRAVAVLPEEERQVVELRYASTATSPPRSGRWRGSWG
jgi:DNA-directed RNA polymerase sigma subunit (sigma70/sigma32)